MTPDLSARLAALEAREKARDEWLTTLQCAVLPFKDRADLSRVGKAFERFVDQIQAAAPPPPAAAPDVIERVREAFKNTIESLELHSRTKPPHHPKSLLGEAREALRLLGARS